MWYKKYSDGKSGGIGKKESKGGAQSWVKQDEKGGKQVEQEAKTEGRTEQEQGGQAPAWEPFGSSSETFPTKRTLLWKIPTVPT